MYLFTESGHALAAAGRISVTYRLWKSPHVTAGKTYPTGFGGAYVIEAFATMPARDIPASDIPLTGSSDMETLLANVAAHTRGKITPETLLYRVAFRYEDAAPQPKPDLPLETVAAKLEAMDARSVRGPWTEAVLRQIETNPQTRAAILANELDWPVPDFKIHVRRLKALGLTLSHPIGYELTPLGLAYLDLLDT